jgi:hypothetical protein
MANADISCANCGTALRGGTKFCTCCGIRVEAAPPAAGPAPAGDRGVASTQWRSAEPVPPSARDRSPVATEEAGGTFPDDLSPRARRVSPVPPGGRPTTVLQTDRRGSVLNPDVPAASPTPTRMIPKVQPRLYGWLVVMNGGDTGKDHRITSWPVTIGRDAKCDIVVTDDSVSRIHARVRRENGTAIFEDGGSANGSMRNGKRVQATELRDGDLLKLGETWLLYKEAVPRERPK